MISQTTIAAILATWLTLFEQYLLTACKASGKYF